jgi:hypothetical protein
MKKILHISILLFYLPAVLGVGFNIHYCGGEVESVSVFTAGGKGCCCGDMNLTGCCNDRHEFIKLDENSQVTPGSFAFNAQPVTVDLIVFSSSDLSFFPESVTSIASEAESPPIISASPAYIRFKTLLI